MPQDPTVSTTIADVPTETENDSGTHRIRLSRSPHPYFQRRPEHLAPALSQTGLPVEQTEYEVVPSVKLQVNGGAPAFESYFDSDRQSQRKPSLTPSDSGTEADDESGTFLKGLPAPPAILRKGLKDSKGLGISSPLLTPSCLDDECRRRALEVELERYDIQQDHAKFHEETARLKQKFSNRRRAELLRRTTETFLLFGVGWTSIHTVIATCHRGFYLTAIIVGSIYLSYPIRLILRQRPVSSNGFPFRPFMRIPAAFDPATLLYPVLLPVFVVASLSTCSEISLTINLVLAISSVPRTIVPLHDGFSGHTSLQWLLSVLPLTLLEQRAGAVESENLRHFLNPESLVLLYPLHQTLLATLRYLTTTSLLPAELQLASVAMINLLLLSESPQAVILQALLWVGGLLTFIMSGRILRWAVVLARVPSWRFRQHDPRPQIRNSIWHRTLWFLRGLFGKPSTLRRTSDNSDSDNLPRKGLNKKSMRRGRQLALSTDNNEKPNQNIESLSPKSALAGEIHPHSSANDLSPLITSRRRRQRSYTLPSDFGAPTLASPLDLVLNRKTHRTPLNKSQVLQSLTKTQAAFVSWLYALYVYSMLMVIIGFPVRLVISRHALHGHEPVGWALGYLFGDLDFFRRFTKEWGLDSWISLPRHRRSLPEVDRNSSFEEFRWKVLGAANSRLLICFYCIATITVGLAVVLRLSRFVEVDTRRKVFHGMMVAMFLPTIFVDPAFAALALGLIFVIFLLLDLFRASQLPPLSRPLTYFLAPYVDGRDHRGPVIVSHIFLLIGCAIPLWLSLASTIRVGEGPWNGWELQIRDLSMISGVVCVGMGDAAASLIGRRFGRRRWCWSGGKSLEGSLAFAIAVVLGLCLARIWLIYGKWAGDSGEKWMWFISKAVTAAVGASLTEAVLTGGNDNVIVPVVLWLLVRGLKL